MQQQDMVAGWIRDAGRVVYLCGAGLSVASGINAYRTGTNAVWGEYVLEWGTRAKFMADPATCQRRVRSSSRRAPAVTSRWPWKRAIRK